MQAIQAPLEPDFGARHPVHWRRGKRERADGTHALIVNVRELLNPELVERFLILFALVLCAAITLE